MFEPRTAVASLSGVSDVEWARNAAPFVGCAFLGGIALDEQTRVAAHKLKERDRNEFLPPDPIAFIDDQLAAMTTVDVQSAMNVRSVNPDKIEAAASVCAEHGAILELNAHCRQAEMCEVGAGESLLTDNDRLREYVAVAADTGPAVSVKVRTEVPGVDLPALAADLSGAGTDIVHVDAMDSESEVEAVVAAAPDATVIANNGVRDFETVREYLDYGADAVSVGRPSNDPVVLERVSTATENWFETEHANRTESSADA